jgi:uncharacterized membrane protein YuzA (DUF378 family)
VVEVVACTLVPIGEINVWLVGVVKPQLVCTELRPYILLSVEVATAWGLVGVGFSVPELSSSRSRLKIAMRCEQRPR